MRIFIFLVLSLFFFSNTSADIISFTYEGGETYGNPSQSIEGFGFGELSSPSLGGGGGSITIPDYGYNLSVCKIVREYILMYGKNVSTSFLSSDILVESNLSLDYNRLKYYIENFENNCNQTISENIEEKPFNPWFIIIPFLVISILIIFFIFNKKIKNYILFFKNETLS